MRIIDLHNNSTVPYLYCGRYMGGRQPREASPLGNKFKVKEYGRNALKHYRRWLFEQIEAGNPQIMFLLREAITEDSTLACWCVNLEGEAIFTEPERCHCQVIWKAWRWLRSTS